MIFQLSARRNLEAESGLDYLINTFFKRTYAEANNFSQPYRESLDSSVWGVLEKYFIGDAFVFDNAYIVFKMGFSELIYVFIGFSLLYLLMVWRAKKNPRHYSKGYALLVVLWLSILAPLSWFVIFKSHSYVHTHMNFIVWYMPFMLFGFVWIGYVTSRLSTFLFARFK